MVKILDDDEDDEIQEIPPPTTKSRITVDVSKSNKPPREYVQCRHAEQQTNVDRTCV